MANASNLITNRAARTVGALGAVVAVACLLTACGSGQATTTTQAPPPAAPATAAPPPAPATTQAAPPPAPAPTSTTTTQAPPPPPAPAPAPATSTTAKSGGVKAPPAGFSIVGNWQVVGNQGWGQAQPGAIVMFNGSQCNLYSPQDTYLYSNGKISGTGLLGGNYSFLVNYKDDNDIDLVDSNVTISLSR